MGKSKRQAASDRIAEAFIAGAPPNPTDVEYIDRNSRNGGTPLRGTSYQLFQKKLNYAFAYLYAMAQGMTADDALNHANLGMETEKQKAGLEPKEHINKKNMEAYCKCLKNGPLPDDPRARWCLEHTRAALEQVERVARKNPKTRQKLSKDYDYPMHAPEHKPDRVTFPK